MKKWINEEKRRKRRTKSSIRLFPISLSIVTTVEWFTESKVNLTKCFTHFKIDFKFSSRNRPTINYSTSDNFRTHLFDIVPMKIERRKTFYQRISAFAMMMIQRMNLQSLLSSYLRDVHAMNPFKNKFNIFFK